MTHHLNAYNNAQIHKLRIPHKYSNILMSKDIYDYFFFSNDVRHYSPESE